MKLVLLTTAVFFAGAVAAFAQQSQIRQEAQQSLSQSRSNATQFEATLNDLQARNASNVDAAYYNQLRAEINRLEAAIETEQARIRASLDAGTRVGPEMFNRVQRLIEMHAERLAELQEFVSGN